MVHLLRRTPESTFVRDWTPQTLLGASLLKALPFLPPELAAELRERIAASVVIESSLALVHFEKVDDDRWLPHDYGIVSRKVMTDAGMNFIVDAFQNTKEVENLKYHGIGSGTGAEAAGNTALGTEFTTQLNPDSTRATGSLTEGASANIFRTVGTNTVDASVTCNEHGIFDQAATGGGTLLDRSMFSGSAVGMVSGDSLQSTYDATFASGG